MLILSEISKKVQEILNNSNSGFLFVANGTGFILDSIVDKEQKENVYSNWYFHTSALWVVLGV